MASRRHFINHRRDWATFPGRRMVSFPTRRADGGPLLGFPLALGQSSVGIGLLNGLAQQAIRERIIMEILFDRSREE